MVTSIPTHHISKLPSPHPPRSAPPTFSTVTRHILNIQFPSPQYLPISLMASITPCPTMPSQPLLPSPPQSPKLKSRRHRLRKSMAPFSATSRKPSAANSSLSTTRNVRPACVSKSTLNRSRSLRYRTLTDGTIPFTRAVGSHRRCLQVPAPRGPAGSGLSKMMR